MRYWVFENKEIIGPYNPDELSRLPHYSAKSLVCPEDRRGQDTRDWNWAEKFPELSSSLVQAHPPGPGINRFGGTAAEPTLKDLKALGILQDKVDALERSISSLQESLRAKEADLSGLRAHLVEKARSETALSDRCAELERRLAELSTVRPALDQAALLERQLESVVEAQRGEISGLGAELSRLRDAMHGFEERLKARPEPLAPPPPLPAAIPALAPIPAPPPLPLAPEPEEPKPRSARLKAAALGAGIGAAALLGWLLLRPSHKAAVPAPPPPPPVVAAPPPKPPPAPAPSPAPVPKWKQSRPRPLAAKSRPMLPPPSLKEEKAPAERSAPEELMLPGMEVKKGAPKPSAPPPPETPAAKMSEDDLLKALIDADPPARKK